MRTNPLKSSIMWISSGSKMVLSGENRSNTLAWLNNLKLRYISYLLTKSKGSVEIMPHAEPRSSVNATIWPAKIWNADSIAWNPCIIFSWFVRMRCSRRLSLSSSFSSVLVSFTNRRSVSSSISSKSRFRFKFLLILRRNPPSPQIVHVIKAEVCVPLFRRFLVVLYFLSKMFAILRFLFPAIRHTICKARRGAP